MRIIAGQAKGRKIELAPNSPVRPTSDRVREAIFNSLYSLGGVEAKSVLDAFAGSGALGLEALSRGAAHATFIDNDPASVKTIKANIAALGFSQQSTVIVGDALALLGQPESLTHYDIAFCDPPYSFDAWDDLLLKLNCQLLVAETNQKLPLNSRWKSRKVAKYGATFISIAKKVA